MSMIYTPGDHPADVMHRASAVTAFIAEALVEGKAPGASLILSDQALNGLCLITQELSSALTLAANNT